MTKSKILNTAIAGVSIKISIDECFKNIYKFLSKFSYHNRLLKLGPVIKITKREARSIKLSEDYNNLEISGNDIDDLQNPFNLIGIIQIIFRFAGIHSLKNNIFLLHGSAAIVDNKAFFFGDDGKNIGKTLSSIECALESNQYISDEFCFLNMNTKEIFSYPFIPIHFRPDVKKHFVEKHNIILPMAHYKRTRAGYFIEPSKLFNVINIKKLEAFVFPHFYNKNEKPKLQILNQKQRRESIKICIISHLLKFFYPHLDRMQFTKRKDTEKIINYNSKIVNNLINKLSLKKGVNQIIEIFPCYRIYIANPCNIVKVIKSIN